MAHADKGLDSPLLPQNTSDSESVCMCIYMFLCIYTYTLFDKPDGTDGHMIFYRMFWSITEPPPPIWHWINIVQNHEFSYHRIQQIFYLKAVR